MEDKQQKKQIKLSDAYNNLDRIIGFVSNCDNKASIMVGFFGVIATLILSSDGIIAIKKIISNVLIDVSWLGIVFLLCWGISVICLIIGIVMLLLTLKPNLKSENGKSNIYFGDIAACKKQVTFHERLLDSDENDLLDDVISQIFTNACICNKKFTRYKLGLLFSLIGYGLFFAIWILGVLLF